MSQKTGLHVSQATETVDFFHWRASRIAEDQRPSPSHSSHWRVGRLGGFFICKVMAFLRTCILDVLWGGTGCNTRLMKRAKGKSSVLYISTKARAQSGFLLTSHGPNRKALRHRHHWTSPSTCRVEQSTDLYALHSWCVPVDHVSDRPNAGSAWM